MAGTFRRTPTALRAVQKWFHVQQVPPVQYFPETFGIQESKLTHPPTKGFRLWRKLLKQYPRMKSWERPDPPRHLLRYHQANVSWDRVRYRWLVVPDEEWPSITLKSEDLVFKDLEDWRLEHRLQLEGDFTNLRRDTFCKAPNNLGPVDRELRAHEYHLQLRERNSKIPKFHPPRSELLDYSL
eukprot:Sspe_Gene.101563::Locus_76150_Transcript_1_1_Confidence_1.000_Length_618::g.101563::m.101563